MKSAVVTESDNDAKDEVLGEDLVNASASGKMMVLDQVMLDIMEVNIYL
jgi:hypothetical protein